MTRFATRLLGLSILLSVVVNNPALVSKIVDQGKNAFSGVITTYKIEQTPVVEEARAQSFSNEARFREVHGGVPVVWRTCSTVPVLVNPGVMGDEGVELVKRAIEKLNKVTGVRFVFKGTTNEVPSTDWYLRGGSAGADGFAPVIVAFANRESTDMLESNAVGSAVANPAGKGNERRLVTGAVVIAEDALMDLEWNFNSGASVGGVLLHELGHIVGLDHAPVGLMSAHLNQKIKPSYSSAIKAAFKPLQPHC
jgi:hypothetical protein